MEPSVVSLKNKTDFTTLENGLIFEVYIETPEEEVKPFHHHKIYRCKRCCFQANSLISLIEHAKLTHPQIAFGPYECSINPPEDYKCTRCTFKTHLKVHHSEHVQKSNHKSPLYELRKIFPYRTCLKCRLSTYSGLVLFKHVCSGSELVYSENTKSVLARLRLLRNAVLKNQLEILNYDNEIVVASSFDRILQDYVIKTKNPRKNRKRPKLKVAPEKGSKTEKKICDQCGQQLCGSKSLKQHMIIKHTAPEDIEWFRCPECPYKGKLLINFNSHMLHKHADRGEIKMATCSFCPYRNVKASAVKRHYKLVHAEGADVEWFQCRVCPHKTRWRDHLKRHVLEQHQGDFKMIQCEHCPYRAKQKIHMKLHVAQKHTPDAEVVWFKCDQCDYKSKLKAGLKSHILKKHTSPDKINWFVCDMCGYRALERSLLKKHVSNKH